MIEIEGSFLEGGGQIVRTALALSTLTGKPFKVINIRKNRPNPGLKNQHLHAVNVYKELCNAVVKGDALGSTELEFIPGKLDYHNLNIDIGTAGSITLFLQALMPVLVFSDKKLIVKVIGGTDTKHSMPIDYFTNVFLPHMRRFGEFETELAQRGYYPKGGGRFILKIKPNLSFPSFRDFESFHQHMREEIKPFDLAEQKVLAYIKGVSHASKDLMSANVAERQAKTARYMLNKYDVPVKIDAAYYDTLSTGSGVAVWAFSSKESEFEEIDPVILGADALGERGKKAELVGEEAGLKLAKEIDAAAAADYHFADQILPYLALVGGQVKASKITDHTRTNIKTIELFINVKFSIDENIIKV